MYSGLNFAPTAQHAEWQTDFSDHALGAQLHAGPFFSRLDHLGTTDNSIVADGASISGKCAAMSITGVAGDVVAYTKPLNASALADVQVLTRFKLVAAGASGGEGPALRLSANGQNGYNATTVAAGLVEDAEFLTQNRVGNVGGTGAFAWSTGVRMWARLEMIGTTLRSKWWLDGVAEPAAWVVSGTDGSYTSGYVGLMSRPNMGSNFDWFSVATGGRTASSPNG